MAVASTVFVKKVHLAASRFATLFRVNTATAWVASEKPIRVSKPTQVTMYPGDVLLRGARPLQAGLHVGGGDLTGWKSEVITASHIGGKFARFVNLECKYGTGRATPDQINFHNQVIEAGGISGIIYSEDEAIALLIEK